MTNNFVYLYLILINLITFFAFYIDKHRARSHMRRIPEGALFLLSFLGGSFGAYFAMHFFHHKNRKPIFRLGIPLILLINFVLFGYLLFFKNFDAEGAKDTFAQYFMQYMLNILYCGL